jgi:putative ABC transport system permease protein
MLKRSWLSIKRKLGRTMILTLIFFMMANLVLSAFIIKSAVSAQINYAKSTLGGTISVQADMETIRKNQEDEMKNGGDPSEMFKSMSRPSVSVETANKIVSNYTDYIKDYSYGISVSGNSYNLETVETKGFGGRGGNMGNILGMPSMFGGSNSSNDSSDSTLDSDITIYGVNAYAYIDGVSDETITIKDGTYFDENSSDSVMISYEFAELNSLKVEDTIKIKNIYTEKSVYLTIIGIYDTSSERANANTMYMNTETASKFLDAKDYNDGNYSVNDVKFYMINSDYADEFVEKVNAEFTELAENNLKFAVDTSEYDSLSSSIESVGSFADTILIIVIIASIIIITLIVTINVKDRRYEIGVLMSLGASKKNVIGQIATELIVIGTIGFALASVTGTFFASTLGNSIIESQTTSSNEQSERNFGRPGAMTGGMPGSFSGGKTRNSNSSNIPDMPDGNASSSMKDIINGGRKDQKVELDINAELIDYLLLFITGYFVIIIALVIPSVSVMRYQPKEILAGKE